MKCEVCPYYLADFGCLCEDALACLADLIFDEEDDDLYV